MLTLGEFMIHSPSLAKAELSFIERTLFSLDAAQEIMPDENTDQGLIGPKLDWPPSN
jgi:hypothetical protein